MDDKKISYEIYDVTGQTTSFSTYRNLYDFCVTEKTFWEKQRNRVRDASKNSINHAYLNSADTFGEIINTLDGIKEAIKSYDENQLIQFFNNLQNNYSNHLRNNWIWSGQAFAESFVECLLKGGEQAANAFIDYVVRKQTSNVQQFACYNGYLMGYEFDFQNSDICKRSQGERASLEDLRTQLSERKNQLFSEVDSLKHDFLDWDATNREDSTRLYRAHKYLGERKIRNQNRKFNRQVTDWKQAITDLEKTYEEKLKLKKPAEYWSKAARKYGIQGGLWTLGIVALAVVGLVYFREFFIAWLQGKEIAVQLNSLQGVILFGSIGTVYAFLVRVFSRLAFSSFHLMRDAEEREQLTYLYLSLTNESEMDKQSRDIVLQALFSRSETGLLAHEHGPTMPGIGDMLKTVSK